MSRYLAAWWLVLAVFSGCMDGDARAPTPTSTSSGGGKSDDPQCTSTCSVACSAGTCATPTQVTSGGWHSCARLDDGSVWCWGSDWTGQLGLGLSDYAPYGCGNGTTTTPCRRRPHRLQGLPPVRAIAGGNDHTCAILEDRTVRCWGSNYASVLGIGDRPESTCNVAGVNVDCLRTPDGDPELAHVTALAPGEHHTCALTMAGEVWCWGTNGNGQLGSQRSASSVPVLVPALSGVTSLATGKQHSCAVLADTTVKCWGRNEYGQIGNGTSSYWQWTPDTVVGLSGVSQLALGERFSCALLSDGSVRCWGNNRFGELGTGSFVSSLVPVTVSGLTDVVEIDAGPLRACARTQTDVRCWGLGGDALGAVATTMCPANPSYACAAAPLVVAGLPDTSQLAISGEHACALASDGHVYCWGDNLVGTLGDGSLADRADSEPVEW